MGYINLQLSLRLPSEDVKQAVGYMGLALGGELRAWMLVWMSSVHR